MASAEPSLSFNLLHRTCKLVVLLCFLHISVTVFFYVRSLDIRFAFVQNQQNGAGSAEPAASRAPEPVGGAPTPDDKSLKTKTCPQTSPLLGQPLPHFTTTFCYFNFGI